MEVENTSVSPNPEEEEDLEDGELSSSDDEDNANPTANASPPHLVEDYELIERPMQRRAREVRNSVESPRLIARPSRPPPPLGATTFKPLKDNDDSDEDEGVAGGRQLLQSSSDDDDSDEDLMSGKKRRFVPSHGGAFGGGKKAPWLQTEPGTSVSHQEPTDMEMQDHNDAFKSQAEAFQQKRKVNNIWGQLLQDEMVSDIFGKVGVQEESRRNVNVERGPESYSFQFKQDLTQRFGVVRSDSSDLSSAGLSDNELQVIKNLELASKKDKAPHGEEGLDEDDARRKLDSNARKRKYQPKKSRKRHLHHTKLRVLKRLMKMKPNVLAKYIAGKLDEPKHSLVERAIHTVGKHRCVSLFLKTMKILRRGGLMIKNQQRSRTPGGVFFYLLRGDPRIPYKLVNRLFDSEKSAGNKIKKKKQSKQLLQNKAKLEALQSKQSEKSESSSVSHSETCSVDNNKMEEDQQSNKGDSTNGNSEADDDSDEYYGLHIDETGFPQTAANNVDCGP